MTQHLRIVVRGLAQANVLLNCLRDNVALRLISLVTMCA